MLEMKTYMKNHFENDEEKDFDKKPEIHDKKAFDCLKKFLELKLRRKV